MEGSHLGGYVPGGDKATWYPEMWDWLVARIGIRSVLDIGCGDGQALGYFRELGCDVVGIEGVPQEDPAIRCWDYSDGAPEIGQTFDLGWSCEFVEHVEERYVPNILNSFAKCRVVLMTHAEPGQEGHHHVNCQPSAYWQGALAAIGYQEDAALTDVTRRLSSINTHPHNHFLRSGRAFRPRGMSAA